jgi:hypothetical protein
MMGVESSKEGQDAEGDDEEEGKENTQEFWIRVLSNNDYQPFFILATTHDTKTIHLLDVDPPSFRCKSLIRNRSSCWILIFRFRADSYPVTDSLATCVLGHS